MILNASNGGLLADTYVMQSSSDNYGTSAGLTLQSCSVIGNNTRIYFLWDLSKVSPYAFRIIDAELNSFYYSHDGGGGAGNHEIYNSTNLWNETNITWNNAPLIDSLQQSISPGTDPVWNIWNITPSAAYQVNQSNRNLSLVMKFATENVVGCPGHYFISKESTNVNKSFLNITYSFDIIKNASANISYVKNSQYLNITANITGFNFTIINQETANSTLLNDTGSVWNESFSYTNLSDSNWSSIAKVKGYSSNNDTFFATININYSKPYRATNNSLWEIKYGFGSYVEPTQNITTNFSIPSGCWNQSVLQLKIYTYARIGGTMSYCQSDFYCYDGIDWNNNYLGHAYFGGCVLYEERMNWNYTNIDRVTLDIYYPNGTVNTTNVSMGYPSSFVDNIFRYNYLAGSVDGNYTAKVWANLTDGYSEYSSTWFIVDNTNPNIFFNGSTTNTSNITQSYIFASIYVNDSYLNYSIIRLYNSSGGLLNSSTSTTINFTNLLDGLYYLNASAIDLVGNINNTETRTVVIDTSAPQLTLINPESKNYGSNISIPVNFTAFDQGTFIDRIWYNVRNKSNGAYIISNTTITGNLTFNLSNADNDYNITIYVNDSLGNLNWTIRTFGIRLTKPVVVLNNPAADSYLNYSASVLFNFTPSSGYTFDRCILYLNTTGSWAANETFLNPSNNTPISVARNITEGSYIWNAWCNDTFGNNDWALNNNSLTTDTTLPSVSVSYPTNGLTISGSSVTLQYNISDSNLDSCYFTLRDQYGVAVIYPENTSLNCSDTSRLLSLNYATYTLFVYGRDKATNIESINATFITQVPTSETPQTGGGTPYTITEIVVKAGNWTQLPETIARNGGRGSSFIESITLENSNSYNMTIKLFMQQINKDPGYKWARFIVGNFRVPDEEIVLSPGERKEIKFEVVVPQDAGEALYMFNIMSSDPDGKAYRHTTFSVDTRPGLNILQNLISSSQYEIVLSKPILGVSTIPILKVFLIIIFILILIGIAYRIYKK